LREAGTRAQSWAVILNELLSTHGFSMAINAAGVLRMSTGTAKIASSTPGYLLRDQLVKFGVGGVEIHQPCQERAAEIVRETSSVRSSCADHLGTSSIWRSCSALKIAFVFIL
jgi:hypothetical protein